MENQREKWLLEDETKLLAACAIDHFKATGKGGQKRNKTSSAVRLIHSPTGIAVTASESRKQSENLSSAIRKLKIAIALGNRQPFSGPLDMERINPRNPRYPVWVAILFDLLDESGYDAKSAAEKLEISPSKLIKTISKHPELWTEFNRRRTALGLVALKT